MIDEQIEDIEDFVADIEDAMTDFGLNRNHTIDDLLNALDTELASEDEE